MISLRIFISCVSAEFRGYREQLRTNLTAANREIKIQEDFSDGGGTLLEKLDDYITAAQAMIHLIGKGAGSTAKPAEVEAILERHPDFLKVLPALAGEFDPEKSPFTYTQWECLLAIYHRVPCYIYRADDDTEREPDWELDADAAAIQEAHFQRLRDLGQDRRTLPFDDARDVAMRFLSSYLAEQMGAGVRDEPEREAPEITWPERPATVDYSLADREQEIDFFLNLVTGLTKERMVFFHGPSDRGKSVLANTLTSLAGSLDGIHNAQASFKNGIPLHEILEDLSRDLEGVLRFPRCQRESARGNPDGLRTAFLRDLEDATEPGVLILDTYEQADLETQRWVESRLLPFLSRKDGIRLVLAGQKVPETSAGNPWFPIAKPWELPPIEDTQCWCDYAYRVLGLTHIATEQIELLVTAALGSPRVVGNLLGNLKQTSG